MKRSAYFLSVVGAFLCFTVVVAQPPKSQQYVYQDRSRSFEERADDLLQLLTLDEKIQLMQDVSKPVTRLGIKPYNWWNEALHGVARSGLATVFPQPVGMAASFDEVLVNRVFSAVSDEARAKYSRYVQQGSHERYQGLTMWTPTINIFRDPRWGRGMETYGEDPYLTSLLGVAAVQGLQGPSGGEYDKIHACAKHFAVHSGPEWNRHSFDAKNIKQRDLYETYLPAFEALVKDGNVREVMCAYNRFEGDPCCGSDQLLMQILRRKWGFEGIVVADCGAIADFYKIGAHQTHADAAQASATAVRAGTDLDCGTSYRALLEAVQTGVIKEKEIDASVRRLLLARFRLGEMDEYSDVPWNHIPYHVVASAKHHALSLQMARASMTLLQNKNHILPLNRTGLKIAVMGPNAQDSVMQWGNYNGTPAKTVTVLEGIREALGSHGEVIYEQGSGLVENYIMESAYNQCKTEKGKGFQASYWNKKSPDGLPDVETNMPTPFALCTSGATVFAPGVALQDFFARYNTTFTPQKNGEVVFDLYVNGEAKLKIDGKEVKSVKTGHGSRKMNYMMSVEQGRSYAIELDFSYFKGDAQLNVDFGYRRAIDVKESIAKVASADIVIFVGGISPALEGEEMGVNFPGFRKGDRTDIELPAVQREFLAQLKKAGKKVVFVNCSGSAVGLVPETEHCEAILQAWYPGQAGGTAVAETLFGLHNPSGRLPITFYRDTTQLPDFENYDMKGRTYRYFNGKPLFPFGFGLSYSSFQYDRMKVDQNVLKRGEGTKIRLTIPIKNVSQRDGQEVVQLYIKRKGDEDGPRKELRAIKKVDISAGEIASVLIELSEKEFAWWDEEQLAVVPVSGTFEVMVGGSSQDQDLQRTTVEIK